MLLKQGNMDESFPHISVIIPTRNRAESLHITLECLASADRESIRAQIIVVDNGSSDGTKDVIAKFQGRISDRYIYEPAQGVTERAIRSIARWRWEIWAM